MCCRLQTQTKAAVIICCILTCAYIGIEQGTRKTSKGTSKFYSRDQRLLGRINRALNARYEAKIPGYVFCIVSDVLCLIGAYKYEKYLLMPFIVKPGLFILGLVLFGIFPIQLGFNFWMDHSSDFFPVLITLPYVILGLFTYFLVTAIRFFLEISAVTSRRSERTVLQPISSQPVARSTEVGNNRLHSGYQSQTYEYQEQPSAYQLQGYPKRNVEMNSYYSSNQV